MAGLHQHQSLEHPHTTTVRTFLANRDQVPGRSQCAHCDTEFLCLAALKHHIDGGHCQAPLPGDPPLLWHHPVIVTGLHGGTFDHWTGYKSLLRRLGHICGQTSSALRNVGCTCLRPPAQPHARTVFSQLALFAHYDLTKFSDASAGTVLAHALKLVLSPTWR